MNANVRGEWQRQKRLLRKGKGEIMSDSYDSMNMIPGSITVEDCRGSRDTNIMTYQLSTMSRIYLAGTITQQLAMDFMSVASVLAEEQKPMEIILNTPGGEVMAGLTIYDLINSYKFPVTIYCAGYAASMGAVILAGGQKGRRFILPNSKIMIHEPLISGGLAGSASSIEKTAKNILEIKAVINKILSQHTGRSVKEINEATLHDHFMTPEEAIEFGICDEIRSIF